MYAELLCRTHYSFLRGASHPHELVNRAAELGLSALGIVDRNGVYAIPKAYVAAKSHPKLKLIVGAEVTLEGLPFLNLLALDRQGYGLMCRILTESHRGKPKGGASLDFSLFRSLMDRPGRTKLVAIPQLSSDVPEFYYTDLREIFGDRLYFPASKFLDGGDRQRVETALEHSRKYDARVIATNDVHFHEPGRKPLQDVLTSVREGVALEQAGSRLFSNSEKYLKSPVEMIELFRDFPEAISNTIEIAERFNFSPGELRYRYPAEWIPSGETTQSYLEKQTCQGAQGRYPQGIPEDVARQLRYELDLIAELQFADYFLTIWEIVEFAKARKILCQGRGSAANSAVCYCLGITAIDPVRMSLLFERFISVERGEPPDIDVDFEHERREEVIQHIYEKYGRDRAGMVAAIITYRSRSCLRDISKALGGSREEAENSPLEKELYGFPRHLSIHSGGFTLSADPIIETVPIEPARMEGRTIVQWDKEDLAAIGLLKVDILALGMLTAIRKTLDLVRPKKEYSLSTIPTEDPETYRMIRAGDTIGVFQIESRAQIQMLKRLLPENFYDLVIEVAIVRPGPIMGEMVHPYLRRRRGEESSQSPDPRLEPILSRTLGVPLFQEQVMKMAIHLAGFTPGEADELRRAIGAWRSSGSIEKMGKRLVEGLIKSGLSQEFVERIFKQIQGFSEYGFPESHAASFALLAYISSYLKCHYPAEFTCALINSQPMGFYSNHTLIETAKRHGVVILPVQPNLSEWDCTLEGEALRIGWRVVQGLGEADACLLVEEREKRPFLSLPDFLARTHLRLNVLSTLAIGDAFTCFGLSQREALWEILACRAQAPIFSGLGTGEQMNLFQPLTDYQAIRWDFSSYGLSARGHPIQAIRKLLSQFPPTTTDTARRAPHGRVTRVAGMVIARQRPQTGKGTVFATLEDEFGVVDLILHAGIYEKYESVFVSEPFLVASGQIQRDKEAVNLIVRDVQPLHFEDWTWKKSHDFH